MLLLPIFLYHYILYANYRSNVPNVINSCAIIGSTAQVTASRKCNPRVC